MASFYVRSAAVGTGTGANWANAFTNFTAAIAASAAGDIFYEAEDHAETTAAGIGLGFPGTPTSPNFIYCVDHNGSVPPVSADLRTTGSISTTGSSAININGSFYWYGNIFNCGNSSGNAQLGLGNGGVGIYQRYDSCAFNLVETGAGNIIANPGAGNSQIRFNNTTFGFTATNQALSFSRGKVVWTNTPNAITGSTLPTTLFGTSTNSPIAQSLIQGVDLSALGTGKTIFPAGLSQFATLVDCKLGASVTVAAAISTPVCRVNLIRCDSGATNTRNESYAYEGVQTTETTIVRTGGASDGTTPVSWKIVSTANPRWVLPFESQPIAIWNDSTSAITTLTIYGTTTGGGVPNNDDIWVEVEYLGSSTTPQGSFITTTKADNLAPSTTTNNSTDGSTWGGGGAGNGFKIVVPSFTPLMKGPLNITVKVAKASTTYYIDPKVSI